MGEVDDWRMSQIRERGFSVRLHAFFTHSSDPRDGIVLKISSLLDCSEAAHGKLHCFRRTTHSRSGDIQVGMGMSYSITRSGNLHSNAPKSAPIFPPLASHCFPSTQLRGCMMDSAVSHTTLHCWGPPVMMGDKFSAGRAAGGLGTGDQ